MIDFLFGIVLLCFFLPIALCAGVGIGVRLMMRMIDGAIVFPPSSEESET